MSTVAAVVIGLAVAGLVISRQFTASKYGSGRSPWIMPLVFTIVAFTVGGGLLDHRHLALSVVLEVAAVVISLIGGALIGGTSRLWHDSAGELWTKGTGRTVAVWVGAVAARVGIMGVGHLAGVHLPTGGLLLALAALFLGRTAVIEMRRGGLGTAPAGAAG